MRGLGFGALSLAVCATVLYVAGGPWIWRVKIRHNGESFSIRSTRELPRSEDNINASTELSTVSAPFAYDENLRRNRSDQALILAYGVSGVQRGADSPLVIALLFLESNVEFPALESVLARAAMPGRVVILTTLNQAWGNGMVHLFLESFRLGEGISHLLDHLVIVALDQVAYGQCKELHTLCYMLKTEGVDFSGEKFFMTEDYLRMMWRRIYFLRNILEMGYSFVFSDADVMWFRDPFPRFDEAADFQMACDIYTGMAEDLNNRPNGGFLYARSNKRTIEFYKYWYRSREDHPGLHDQDVLNEIKGGQDFLDIGLQLRFLDTLQFGGFCQVSKDLEQVCTMHANCCTGLERKVHDLRLVLDDWKRFKVLSPQLKHHQRIYWRAPRQCLLSEFGEP